MLPHLDSGYAVDQAILSEEDRVVIIRFGHDWDPVGACNPYVYLAVAADPKLSCRPA